MTVGRFSAMVGALLWRPADGKYLVLKRADDKDFASGVWECVTGRVDQGEGFTDAVHREVREELGVEVALDFIVGTAHFYRGEARPKNEMVGVQYCCSVQDPEAITVSAEHSAHRWVSAEEAEEMFGSSQSPSHWLWKVIRRAEALRALMGSQALGFYRTEGFEL